MTTLSPSFGALNVTRSRIDAPLDRVWEVLIDRAAWMPTFVDKQHLDGPTNAVGERALLRSRTANGGIATRVEEVLWWDAPHRLVLRLGLEDDHATTAFGDWRLFTADGGTELEFSVHWIDVPEPGMDHAATMALRASYVAHTQAAIDGYPQRILEALSRQG
jgi:uncharacterized protein YndB with AHSA1/START domain